MKEYIAAFLLIIAFVLRECWQLFANAEQLIRPFLFNSMEIPRGTYIYFYWQYGSALIVTAVIYMFIKRLHLFFQVLFALQFIEVIDYSLTYNTAWFESWGVPVGITLVKEVTLTLTLIFEWFFYSFSHKSETTGL